MTTYKAGATWQPINDIRLRVTHSRDIRAPNLNELFQAGTSGTDTVRDPFTNRTGVTYRQTTTGNLDLRPETALSTSIGLVIQPRFLPGFSLSVDGFDIKLRDAIGSSSPQEIVDRCFEGRQDFCASITRNLPGASDRELTILNRPFNFARISVRGIDFDASSRRPVEGLFGGGSMLTLRGLATRYIDNIIDTGVPGVVPVDTVGSLGGSGPPTWIFRTSATIDTPDFSITGVGRGVSRGTYFNNIVTCQTTCPASTPQNPTYDVNRIRGIFYADLNLTAKVDVMGRGDGQLFFNVTNVFDRDPILLPEGGLSANSTYSDLLGRAFRVGIRIQTR